MRLRQVWQQQRSRQQQQLFAPHMLHASSSSSSSSRPGVPEHCWGCCFSRLDTLSLYLEACCLLRLLFALFLECSWLYVGVGKGTPFLTTLSQHDNYNYNDNYNCAASRLANAPQSLRACCCPCSSCAQAKCPPCINSSSMRCSLRAWLQQRYRQCPQPVLWALICVCGESGAQAGDRPEVCRACVLS